MSLPSSRQTLHAGFLRADAATMMRQKKGLPAGADKPFYTATSWCRLPDDLVLLNQRLAAAVSKILPLGCSVSLRATGLFLVSPVQFACAIPANLMDRRLISAHSSAIKNTFSEL
jgi:hypothetical protein